MINLTPFSPSEPLRVDEEEYRMLVGIKRNGWSRCESDREWLAKLHYLRKGREEGKIEEAAFSELEKKLVLNWWKRWL